MAESQTPDPLKGRPVQDPLQSAESQKIIDHCKISPSGYRAAIVWAENYVEMAKGDSSEKRINHHLLFLSLIGELEALAKRGNRQ